jgi:hypothetical protein
MKSFLQLCARAVRTLSGWIFSFALWTVWLALAILLAVQLYIATAHELEIPSFVLRQLESRLAESGLRATFDRTSFDPTGRVLVQNVKVSLPSFSEPVITARAAYVRVNPWMLIVGRVEPREIRIDDATVTIPAMLSPSGRAEEMVQSLNVTLEPAPRLLVVRQLNARAAGVTLTAHGVVPLPRETKKPAADALAEFIAREFPVICRQALAWSEQLAQFEEPAIDLELTPSESGAATIGISVLARSGEIQKPIAARAVNIRAHTRLLLFGDAPSTQVELSLDELQLAENATIRGLHARAFGRLRPRETQLDLREITVTVDAVSVGDITLNAISARLFPRPLPRVDAQIVANFLGAPLSIRGETDYAARTAQVSFEGAISPDVLALISKRAGVDVRTFFDFDTFRAERAEVQLDAGWKFAKLAAQIRVPVVRAHGVTMHDGRARLELAGTRFYAPEAFARVGDNFARGSYEHDLKTHEYRFLLEGRLRPMEIARWFHEWWPNFFQQFDFSAAAPNASVDVRSAWRDARRANVFVFADVAKPIIRGTPFDRVRARLFVRPAFYDALEALVTRGEGLARGRFTYTADPDSHAWHTLDLAIDSSLDLKTTEQLLSPLGPKILEPFQLAKAPDLKLTGTFSSAAAPGGAHEKLRVEARSAGEFQFHHFPLNNVSFVAALNDDELLVDNVVATIGGGSATGRARVWGVGEQRRLGFDFALSDAALGLVAAGVEEVFAHKENRPPAPPGKFVQQKANVRLTLAASAEGHYDNPLSFRGGGSATLQGAEIGAVSLLGSLSELLKFTALRFTEARANFKIEGAKLVFPELTLRGANSAIDAHGEYALDRHALDFNAKISPFHESDSLIKSVVGVVLSPLSSAFEVKLTGTLEKPHWALTLGPGNLLRALTPGESAEKTPAGNEGAPTATPPTPAPTTKAQ